MAGKIGKKALKGSKNHGQQRGLRNTMRTIGNRQRNIDDVVNQAQTGKPKGK